MVLSCITQKRSINIHLSYDLVAEATMVSVVFRLLFHWPITTISSSKKPRARNENDVQDLLYKLSIIFSAEFLDAKNRLNNHIVHWGYLESRDAYYEALSEADVVVSTAQHEFYGVAMLVGYVFFKCHCTDVPP